MKDRKFVNDISFLRGLMIVFVVLGHACSIFAGRYAGHDQVESTVGETVRNIIYTFHMPVFMAISGYLFNFEINKLKNRPWNDGLVQFIVKKIKRLLIPFFFIMYFWRKPLFFLSGTSYNSIKEYLSIGTTGALWFLYTLFAIFVMQRLLVKIICKFDLLCLVLFAVLNIIGRQLSGPIHHILIYNYFFFLGVILNKYSAKLLKNDIQLYYLLVSIVFTFVLIIFSFGSLFEAPLRLLIGTFDCLLLFSLCRRFYSENADNIIYLLSDYSMGIYLFHEPLMILIGTLFLQGLSGWVLVICMAVIGIIGSLLITLCLRTFGLKILIGE